MSSGDIIRIIATIAVAIAIYFTVLVITMRRNVRKVARIFEEKNALSSKTAISATELNIQKQSVIDRAIKKRDNRAHALKFLMDGGVVIITAYERYYLDKKKMVTFRNKLNFIARMMIPNIDNWLLNQEILANEFTSPL